MQLEEIYTSCVAQLRNFVAAAGFDDVVIGLSGGIDSSLVATMAVDALGASAVHGVMLPGPYSSAHSLDDSKQLATNLGIATQTISIIEPYEAFARALAQATGDALGGLAAENTQARCRMVVLMALSNANNWLMLNTGNKSEAAMGYSTLYGDTAGAFAPIGGLYKTQIYALVKWRNAAAQAAGNKAPIPQHVIDKPPSAELSPNQSDEASMGIDYETLDKILIALLDDGCTIEEAAAKGFDKAQVMNVANRYKSYAFKRALEPPFATI